MTSNWNCKLLNKTRFSRTKFIFLFYCFSTLVYILRFTYWLNYTFTATVTVTSAKFLFISGCWSNLLWLDETDKESESEDDDEEEEEDDDEDEEDEDDDELDESSSSEESISPVIALMALIFSDKPNQSEHNITVARSHAARERNGSI